MKIWESRQDDGCYWYPYRPVLRWPLIIFALVLTFWILGEAAVEHRWHWSALALWTWFASALGIKPYRRRKTGSYYVFVVFISGTLLLFMAAPWLMARYFH